ncbi:GDSL esterase/lipase-like protein [Drosera capensis]
MKISIVIVLFVTLTSSTLANGRLTINEARNLTAEKKMTCNIVIGDSTVNTGNNNYLPLSIFRANFPPYGKNSFGGIPTGRFCNGTLAPDFLGEYFNLGKFVPPYLQLKSKGIIDKQPFASYASAGTGFDDCTAVGVFPFPQEMQWFNQYAQDLSAIVGNGTAKKTINNAICLFSMGTNDWIRNYFIPENQSIMHTQPTVYSR